MTFFSEKVYDNTLSMDDRVSFFGKWIDHSADESSQESLIEAVAAAQKLLTFCESRKLLSVIHYFLANAHSAIREITVWTCAWNPTLGRNGWLE